MNLARFLGRWGSLDPLMAMKSSSFSLLVSAITNLGGQTAGIASLPEEDPPFLLSWAVSDETDPPAPPWWWWWWWLLSLLWLALVWLLLCAPPPLLSCAPPLSGEAKFLSPLLRSLIAIELSEFLKYAKKEKKQKPHILVIRLLLEKKKQKK